MEINNISFTMVKRKWSPEEKTEKEGMMKYFLIQAIASSSFTLLLVTSIQLNIETLETLGIIFIILKMSNAPLHAWFIETIKKIKIVRAGVAITWQKVLPLWVIFTVKCHLHKTFVLVTALTGASQIIKTNRRKEIIAISSIFNNSWLTMTTLLRLAVIMTFTFIYWIAVILSIGTMWRDKVNPQTKKKRSSLMLVNLAGLPPTAGFWGKLLVVQSMLKINNVVVVVILVSLTTANFYTYLKTTAKVITAINIHTTKQKERSNLNSIAAIRMFLWALTIF